MINVYPTGLTEIWPPQTTSYQVYQEANMSTWTKREVGVCGGTMKEHCQITTLHTLVQCNRLRGVARVVVQLS